MFFNNKINTNVANADVKEISKYKYQGKNILPTLSDEKINQIITTFNETKSIPKTVEICDVSNSTVYKYLKKNGIDYKPFISNKLSIYKINQIISTFNETKDINKTAEKCNVSDRTVYKYLNKNNVDYKSYGKKENKLSIYKINQIISTFNETKDIKETAEKCDVSTFTVYKYLKKNGIDYKKHNKSSKILGEIVDYFYNNNCSYEKTALKFDMTASGVRYYIDKYKRNFNRLSDDKTDGEIKYHEINDYFRNVNHDYDKTAKHFNMSIEDIKKYIDEEDIRIQEHMDSICKKIDLKCKERHEKINNEKLNEELNILRNTVKQQQELISFLMKS